MAGMFKRLFGSPSITMLKEVPGVPMGLPFFSDRTPSSQHAAIAQTLEAESPQTNALPVFGVSLEEILARPEEANHEIPDFLDHIFRYLQQRALKAEGIFRISGDSLHIQTLKTSFDKGNYKQALSQWKDYHSVAGLLKLFLRELPEPVFPFKLYDSFIATQIRAEPTQQLAGMWELLRELPIAHKRLLRRLVEFLLEVAKYSEENKMTTSSLAIVFAPNLLRPKNADTIQFISDARYINSIIRSILEQYELLSDALYEGEPIVDADIDGLVPPQPPKRRLWRKRGIEPSAPAQSEADQPPSETQIAPLSLPPPTEPRFSTRRKASRVSSSGSLLDRRTSRAGDFTTRIYQDLASSGGIVIQIEEPTQGDGDPTLAPHYCLDISTGIGVGLRPNRDRGSKTPTRLEATKNEDALSLSKTIDADPRTNNVKLETTNTDFKALLEPTELIPVQKPKTTTEPQTQSKTPEILSVSVSLSPIASEVKPLEEDKPILLSSGADSIISDKAEPLSTPPDTVTEEHRNVLMHTPVSNSEDKPRDTLILSDPHTFISNKLTEDQNKKSRPESIKAMSLSEMKDEKDLLKKLLHDYNYAIEKQYSRLPTREDKEPLRQLYRRYRMLKRRIELFSIDTKQERSRSVSSVTYLKEEESEILKRIDLYKDNPEAQELLQLEITKLKTIQKLILEWDARVG